MEERRSRCEPPTPLFLGHCSARANGRGCVRTCVQQQPSPQERQVARLSYQLHIIQQYELKAAECVDGAPASVPIY
jgi:hypothetical protein